MKVNQKEIEKLIPHRDHMLLVEEATVIDGVAQGSYRVRGDEFFLQGHFPGNPIVPGVILCEMMAQSASVLMASTLEQRDEPATPMFTSLDKVRFKKPVKPGDLFCSRVTIERQKGSFFFCSAQGFVEGELVATASFSFALVS